MSAFDAYIRLDGSLEGTVACDEPMSKHTTYHIGGPAALFVHADTLADLTLTVEVLADEGLPWVIVGKGSNLLVSDEGYRGAVIVLGNEFAHVDFNGFSGVLPGQKRPERVHVTAGAGVGLQYLVQKAFGLSLSGLEALVGTPGSVGGAVRMNAGSREKWISSCVESVTLYTLEDGLRKVDANQIEWGYRSSSIPSDAVIVEVCLELKPSDKLMLRAAMETSLKHRRASQPLSQPSCGSVFKGTSKGPAGLLIDSCGLKGATCGGAQISTVHANFIVNNGNATAQDVLELVRMAQDAVKEEHGVDLRPEVRFLGFN